MRVHGRATAHMPANMPLAEIGFASAMTCERASSYCSTITLQKASRPMQDFMCREASHNLRKRELHLLHTTLSTLPCFMVILMKECKVVVGMTLGAKLTARIYDAADWILSEVRHLD